MDQREGLRAGIAEMRSVAQRLNQWADDLEASFQDHEAPSAEVAASGKVSAPKEKEAVEQAGTEPAAVKKEAKKDSLTLPQVRAILAEKCAAGFGAQVKALIESYGVSTLKEVPAERYEELLEAAGCLGGDADAG